MATNIAGRLADLGRTQPTRVALVDESGGRLRRLSYEELAGRVAALAGGLAARGLEPGDRVLLLLPMSVELYVALLACSHLGAAAVFLDAWSDRRRLEECVRRARPRAFLGIAAAQALRLLSPALNRVSLHLPVGPLLPLERLERRAGGPPTEVDPRTAALVTFTTGTTGAPKAAARSHAFLWAQHRALARHLEPLPEDVDMPVLPIFVLNNLASGITTVLPRFDPRRPARFDPVGVRGAMDREGVTTASGSPAFFDRIAGAGLRLPLRSLFVGGAPVLPPQARRLQEATDGTVHVVYGSTEAEPISGLPVPELLEARGEGLCVGRPVPEVVARLGPVEDGPRDTPGSVGVDEVGEVLVAGEHVLAGYLDDPEEDRRFKIREEGRTWHRTGDAARWDEAGRLWLMGRVSGRVRRAGATWWEMPAVVRAVGLPGVTHAALMAEPDPLLGQRAVLVLECPRGRPPEVPDLGQPVDEVRVLAEIPRDARHRSRTDLAALRRPRPSFLRWLGDLLRRLFRPRGRPEGS